MEEHIDYNFLISAEDALKFHKDNLIAQHTRYGSDNEKIENAIQAISMEIRAKFKNRAIKLTKIIEEHRLTNKDLTLIIDFFQKLGYHFTPKTLKRREWMLDYKNLTINF